MRMTGIKFLAIITLITVAILNKIYYNLLEEDDIPKISGQNWGNRNNSNDIKIFKINISDEILSDIKQKIINDKLPKALPTRTNEFGINMKTLKEFREYLINNYDWRKRENYLNKYPQYKTTIQGLDIHFVHIKPKTTKKTIPLIILHGWPGSFAEFYNMIPKLIDNEKDFTFDIVIPSMPGFFFSDTPEKDGWGPFECGFIMNSLMERLGYSKYYIYGTDWGTMTGRSMAILYPDKVLGVNTPLCGCMRKITILKAAFETIITDWFVDKKTNYNFYFIMRNVGYFYFKATFPDVLGLSFSKTPMGFMSHYLTLMLLGTNDTYVNSEDSGLDLFEKDLLLDQLMLFWTTDTIASSIRIYKYFIKELLFSEMSTNVPFSCPILGKEILSMSDWALSDFYKNIVQRTYFSKSGHFYSLEKDMQSQEMFAKDFVQFVEKTRS